MELEPRRLTVAEYHRMVEAGVFDEDERLELIEGVLVRVSPQKRSHAHAVQKIGRLLSRQLGDEFDVLYQLPVTLGDQSEPEPDVAVVNAEEGRSRTEHPRHPLLVIEVAGESLRKDRGVKAELYARHGVPEYWIVNLEAEAIEIHRDPDPAAARWGTRAVVARGEVARAASVPGVAVPVDGLFG